jgi:hypothetical protein
MEDKKRVGRPSDFTPEMEALAKRVYETLPVTDKQLAAILNKTEQTINNWKKNFPEFFESLKESKAAKDALVVASLYQRATGYTRRIQKVTHGGAVLEIEEDVVPDVTAQIFWVKNRLPEEWTDRRETVVSGPGGKVPVINIGLAVPAVETAETIESELITDGGSTD